MSKKKKSKKDNNLGKITLSFSPVSKTRLFFKWIIRMIRKFNLDGSQDVTDGRVFILWDKANARKVPYGLRSQITKSIAKYKKDLKKHFTEDSYDLDADFYINEILTDIFGFCIRDHIRARLLKNTEINLKWKNRESDKFTLEKPKE